VFSLAVLYCHFSGDLPLKITNNSNIPLALGVWLLHDEYDYINTPNYISVTKMMKPLKSLVLGPRVDQSSQESDLEEFVSRALGHSLHDSIEKAWKVSYKSSLKKLGYSQAIIDRVLINPTHEELQSVKDPIPVYMEQRLFREIKIRNVTFTVGGKYDMVAEGIPHDNKSTTAYTWLFDSKDDDYKLQMSLYRWIDAGQEHPVITEDYGRINFIFTDWQKMQAKTNPNYPQRRLEQKAIPLMAVNDTEKWVRNKIELLVKYYQEPEENIPDCTPEELWMSAPQYKYYADPAKTEGRSTKNFDSLAEANAFKASKGKGIIKTVPGEAKRCAYCHAAPVCKQRLRYL